MTDPRPLSPALVAANQSQQLFQYVPYHLEQAANALARAGEHERAAECRTLAVEASAFSRFWWEEFHARMVALAYPPGEPPLASPDQRERKIKPAPPPPKTRPGRRPNNPFDKKRKVTRVQIPGEEGRPHETPAEGVH